MWTTTKAFHSVVFCLVLGCFAAISCCSSSSKQTGDIKQSVKFSNGKSSFKYGQQGSYPIYRTHLDNDSNAASVRFHRVKSHNDIFKDVFTVGTLTFLQWAGSIVQVIKGFTILNVFCLVLFYFILFFMLCILAFNSYTTNSSNV